MEDRQEDNIVDKIGPLMIVVITMKYAKLSLSEWVDLQQSRGTYTFTRDLAQQELGLKPQTLTKALQRLSGNGRIQQIRREFYTIIPLEYKPAGGLPADWYIDDLMKSMNTPYYVGVLSAAALHGAAHQQPMEFQIVTPVHRKIILAGRIRIRFFLRRWIDNVIVRKVKTYTGYIPVSSPESTALDLIRFNSRIGGLDSVMTILSELSETFTVQDVLEACKVESDRSLTQRLGWMLDNLDQTNLTNLLSEWIHHVNPSKVRLDPSKPYKGGILNRKWHLIVNCEPESEV